MTNPDPARITDEMWKLWTDRPNLAWKLGGIFADKKGYHNTVLRNNQLWPYNYSVREPLDLVLVNRDKARAIDYTMSDSEMIKWTHFMKAAAEDPHDTRLAAVKEFYGTLDGKSVFGLKKNGTSGPWTHSTADISHLWHGHISIFTAFVANWLYLAPLLSVMRGDSFTDWKTNMSLPKKGDSGEDVRYWQLLHNQIAPRLKPALGVIVADGDYGPAFQKAIVTFWKAVGGTGKYDGSYLHAWTALQYQTRYTQFISIPDPNQLRALVNEWLTANVKSVK